MTIDPKLVREEALGWFIRLQDEDAGEADWLAFTAWLEAAPEHGTVYAEIENVWVDLDIAQDHAPKAETTETVVAFKQPHRPKSTWIAWSAAIAAAALVAVTVSVSDGGTQIYQTQPHEMRSLALADGSTIQLNGGSDVRVHLSWRKRSVILVTGEATFDVVHNTRRPFVVIAGDRQVKVVGTEFNVQRHDGDLQVTVRRGIVAVGPKAGKVEARLVAGQQLDHRDGTAGVQVRTVDPNDALAWRSGVLVYHDQRLVVVARDLARYFGKPVIVDANVAQLHFTGALRIGREADMLRNLESFLPVSSISTPQVTRLRARVPR